MDTTNRVSQRNYKGVSQERVGFIITENKTEIFRM